MQYDISSHPLLSEDAAALQPDQLEEYVELAEDLLGLAGVIFTEESAVSTVERALVLQVNYWLEHDVSNPQQLQAERRGDRSFAYYRAAGSRLFMNPLSLQLIERLLTTEGGWENLTSVRTRG